MNPKLNICLFVTLFAIVASVSAEHASDANDYLSKRSEELLKATENALIKPNVSGNLMTRIRQLEKEIKRTTEEYLKIASYDEFVTNTKLQAGNKLFALQNNMEQLLDLLKLIQKSGEPSAFNYAMKISKELHQIQGDSVDIFERELKELDATINEKHPDYMEWYHESKVIDRTLALLEKKFAIEKKH